MSTELRHSRMISEGKKRMAYELYNLVTGTIFNPICEFPWELYEIVEVHREDGEDAVEAVCISDERKKWFHAKEMVFMANDDEVERGVIAHPYDSCCDCVDCDRDYDMPWQDTSDRDFYYQEAYKMK